MRKLGNRRVLGVAVGLTALTIGASSAQAAFSYAYGEQTVSNLIVSGAGLTGATVNGSSTDDSAAVGGPGIAANDTTDALQSYLLTPAPAPQNFFAKYSALGGGPQAGDFTRGDVLLTNSANLFTTGIGASTVAESFAPTSSALETGSSNWNISGTFKLDGSSVTVDYNFANDIMALVSGSPGSADAHFGLLITITDQHGHEIDSIPTVANATIGAPVNGTEFISSGSSSAVLSLAGLTAGDTYTISIDGQSHSTAQAAAVPEPASLSLLAVGAASLLTRRRRRNA